MSLILDWKSSDIQTCVCHEINISLSWIWLYLLAWLCAYFFVISVLDLVHGPIFFISLWPISGYYMYYVTHGLRLHRTTRVQVCLFKFLAKNGKISLCELIIIIHHVLSIVHYIMSCLFSLCLFCAKKIHLNILLVSVINKIQHFRLKFQILCLRGSLSCDSFHHLQEVLLPVQPVICAQEWHKAPYI